MLDNTIKNQLKSYFERLQHPIELVAAYGTGSKASELHELMEDIAACSTKVTVIEAPHALTPSFGVRAHNAPERIRFAGLPMGHEFTSLVLALLQTGGHPPKVDATVVDAIQALSGPLRFEVFVSLSCHNCPDVVQALNLMAALNSGITCTMVDGALFPELVGSRQVMAVPSVFLNDRPFGQGRMTVEEILAKLDTGAEARAANALQEKTVFDTLVVGGGPAGAAAAIYAARKGIRTGILAERFGGQVMDTLGIENLISVKHTEGPQLAAALEQNVREYDVDVMTLQRAKRLIPAVTSSSGYIEVELESGATLKAKSVVLSTGARWREMNVPGEKEYKAKGVCFCPHCDGPLFRGKRVAVIGGGNSGAEAAIDLAGIVAHVTLLEFADVLRADAVLQAKLRSLPNVTVITKAQTTAVRGDSHKVTGLAYQDRETGQEKVLPLEGIFVQIGLLPNTDWLKGSVALSPRGEIEINARGETSVPGVFAAGDCTTVPYKQIIIAMGAGATAALAAFDHLIRN